MAIKWNNFWLSFTFSNNFSRDHFISTSQRLSANDSSDLDRSNVSNEDNKLLKVTRSFIFISNLSKSPPTQRETTQNSPDPFPRSTLLFYATRARLIPPMRDTHRRPELRRGSPIIPKMSGQRWPRLTRIRSIVETFATSASGLWPTEFLNFLLIARHARLQVSPDSLSPDGSSFATGPEKLFHPRSVARDDRRSQPSPTLVSHHHPPNFPSRTLRFSRRLSAALSLVFRSRSQLSEVAGTKRKKNEQHRRSPVRSYRPWIIGKLYLPSGTRAKMVPKTRFNIYAARKDRLEFIPLRRGLGTSSRYLAEYFLYLVSGLRSCGN